MIAQETRAKIERYAQLKREEKAIKAELDLLKPELVEYMKDKQKVTGADIEGFEGSFVIMEKEYYELPDDVKHMEEQFKKAKQDAIARGTAQVKYSHYVQYNGPKD